ncbi:MAG: phosphopantothenoylcysteine decarboxylase [Planctomycetota bacterium]
MTAGPTREYIDRVRFISNPSTGRMGFAVAEAAARRGHRVVLVTGPVTLPDPAGVRVVRVESAADMARAVFREYPRADAVVMTAAVGDYRPARRAPGKIPKSKAGLTLRLVRTIDILSALGARKGRRVLVGFALEASGGRRRARAKLLRKNCDGLVWNRPEAFGAERSRFELLRRGGIVFSGRMSKRVLAERLVRFVETRHASG